MESGQSGPPRSRSRSKHVSLSDESTEAETLLRSTGMPRPRSQPGHSRRAWTATGASKPDIHIHPHWQVPTGGGFPNYYNQRTHGYSHGRQDVSCFALPALPAIHHSSSDVSDDLPTDRALHMLSPHVVVNHPDLRAITRRAREWRRWQRTDDLDGGSGGSGGSGGEKKDGARTKLKLFGSRDRDRDRSGGDLEAVRISDEEDLDRAWPYRVPTGHDLHSHLRRQRRSARLPARRLSASQQRPDPLRADSEDNDSLAVLRSGSQGSEREHEHEHDRDRDGFANVTIGLATVRPMSPCSRRAHSMRILDLVQHNAEQSQELSKLLAQYFSKPPPGAVPYGERAGSFGSPAPDHRCGDDEHVFVKPLRDQLQDTGPKIAVAGGDSPTPPRDTRFFH
ncbi:hypothetical protein KEM52_001635 [Ascosphaera acerosa]|nr:hypothetical protein KEM52_001635 [Ascosphaera acerosa]